MWDKPVKQMVSDPEGVPAQNRVEERGRPDPRLLQLLVCPLTRAELIYDEARQELVSRAAKLAYPIRRGVPIMIPEEARKLND